MDKLLEDGIKAGGSLTYNVVKGFAYLAGLGVAIIVIDFGADKALAIFSSGIEVLKAIIA